MVKGELMSGRSVARDIYFEKHIRPAENASQYLQALLNSPYRTHRRMGIALQETYKDLVKQNSNQLCGETE